LIPPTVPEVRRVILAMAGPVEEREFRLGWSLWRRAHQAVARGCHKASRAAKHAPRRERPETLDSPASAAVRVPVREPNGSRLTEEKWELVRPILPGRKPQRGRPRRDQRQVLRGVLWVMDTGASWRNLPEEEFGPWQTIYGHYRKWLKEGLWSQIVEVLRL
jgi:hypothetical protein